MITTHAPVTESNQPEPRDGGYRPCLLAALVCDIRGFTDLSSHVNSYAHNVFSLRSKVDALLRDFSILMSETQSRSLAVIREQLDGLVPEPSYAVKGTGDGLLIAVEVGPYDDVELQRIRLGESKARHYAVLSALAHGLLQLVNEAKSVSDQPGHGFGHATRQFLWEWRKEIGLPRGCLSPNSSHFRVAGALTFGMGFLRSASDENPEKAGAASLGDAYGHTVNLAFRLCDVAGRASARGASPSILVDRRVGGVLRNRPNRKNLIAGSAEPVKILPYQVPRAMKGIEEHWCYEIIENSGPRR